MAPACIQEPPVYLMWGNDGLAGEEGTMKTATGLSYIPAAKPKLPGHAESYNPPAEYVPTEVGAELLCHSVSAGLELRGRYVPWNIDLWSMMFLGYNWLVDY